MGGYIGARSGTISATVANVQDVTATDTTPEITLKNTTETDADGSRSGKITFKGEQSGGEESTLAQIVASHDTALDDEAGDLIFRTNDGSDGASPTEAMRIDSAQNVGINNSAPSNDLHILGKDTDTSTGITIQTDDTASAVASLTLMSRNSSNVNKTATIKNNAGTLELDSQLDVSYAGGGDFIASFQNTTDATPYGIHVKDAASGANGYPLFQVTNGAGNQTYFRVDSGTGFLTAPKTPMFSYLGSKAHSVSTGDLVWSTANVWSTSVNHSMNNGSHFNPANGRFTAPITGLYHFQIQAQVYGHSSGYFYTYLDYNGSVRSYIQISQGSIFYLSTHHIYINLNANDYVNASSTNNYSGSQIYYPAFSGALVG